MFFKKLRNYTKDCNHLSNCSFNDWAKPTNDFPLFYEGKRRIPPLVVKERQPWSYPFPKGDNCLPSGRDKTMESVSLKKIFFVKDLFQTC